MAMFRSTSFINIITTFTLLTSQHATTTSTTATYNNNNNYNFNQLDVDTIQLLRNRYFGYDSSMDDIFIDLRNDSYYNDDNDAYGSFWDSNGESTSQLSALNDCKKGFCEYLSSSLLLALSMSMMSVLLIAVLG